MSDNLVHALAGFARASPNRLALCADGEKISYGELARRAR